MRKPTPQIPISPKQLKQFAIATVVITGMVALFANGEAAQMQAEVQAREAKNDLLNAEAEKFGTRKVAMGMKVKAKVGGWGGGDGGGDGDGGDGGGTGSIDPDTPRLAPAYAQQSGFTPQHPILPRNLPMTAGGTVTVKGQIASDLQGSLGDAARAKSKGKAGTMFRPNAEQIETLKANSRERTGGASQEDF